MTEELDISTLPVVDADATEADEDWIMTPDQRAEEVAITEEALQARLGEGGPGSGHWGHKGVPGQHGGSAPSGGVAGVGPGASQPGAGMSMRTGPTARARWEKARGDQPAGGVTSTPDEEFIQATQTGFPLETKELGGGVTDTKLVHYEGDGSGVEKWKDDAGGMHHGYSEVGAYEVAQAMGFGDLVPATTWVQSGLKTSQRFIDGARVGKQMKEGDRAILLSKNDTRVRQTLILDEVIGNQDRHWGNYVFDKAGKMYAIDHGHATWQTSWGEIPNWTGQLGHTSGYYQTGLKLTRAELKDLRGVKESSFRAALTRSRVDIKYQDTAWDNLQNIINEGGVDV